MEVMEVRGSNLTRLVMCANITLTDWRRAYNNGGCRPNAECSLPEMLLHEAAGTSVHDRATLDQMQW